MRDYGSEHRTHLEREESRVYAEQRRLAQHRCPIHGACLTQIGGDARGAIVGCTRRDCRFTISEADLPLLRSPEADLTEALRNAIRHYANEMTRRALRDTRRALVR